MFDFAYRQTLFSQFLTQSPAGFKHRQIFCHRVNFITTTTLNFGELSGSGPYSGGGSDNESTGGNGGGSGGNTGGSGSNPVSSSAPTSGSVSAADQVKSMLEMSQHQLPGSYGLYRPPYNNPGAPGTPEPGFGGNRGAAAGHLGSYPFAPMPGQNSYPGYHHLGYPTSQSPVGRDGKEKTILLWYLWENKKPLSHYF